MSANGRTLFVDKGNLIRMTERKLFLSVSTSTNKTKIKSVKTEQNLVRVLDMQVTKEI